MKEHPAAIFTCAYIDEGRIYNNNREKTSVRYYHDLCKQASMPLVCARWVLFRMRSDDSYLFTSDHFIHCFVFFLLSHRCCSTMFCSVLLSRSLSLSLSVHQTIKSIIDDNSRRRLTVIIVSGIERHIRATFTPLKYVDAYTYTDDDD